MRIWTTRPTTAATTRATALRRVYASAGNVESASDADEPHTIYASVLRSTTRFITLRVTDERHDLEACINRIGISQEKNLGVFEAATTERPVLIQ